MSSKAYGSNEALNVADVVDEAGEIEVWMPVTKFDADTEGVFTWLNKWQAEDLIEHLKNAFSGGD